MEDKPQLKKIRETTDIETGETKCLFEMENTDDKREDYPKKYLVKWQWAGRFENRKTMYDRDKALRLYDDISLSGWGDQDSTDRDNQKSSYLKAV